MESRCRYRLHGLPLILVVLLAVFAPGLQGQEQSPPLSAADLMRLLDSGMPEARLLQIMAEACVSDGGALGVQQQLEAAGASPALRRAAEAFACDDTVPVARVEITGAPEALFQGATATLGARVFGSDGDELSGRGAHWSSTNETVLRVDPQGRVEALAPGTSMVRAEVEDVPATVVVTVLGAVAQLDVEPGSMTLGVGEERPVRITARDRVGNALPAEPEIVVADPRVATSEDGMVRGIHAGQTTLLVRAEGGLTRTVVVAVAGDDELDAHPELERARTLGREVANDQGIRGAFGGGFLAGAVAGPVGSVAAAIWAGRDPPPPPSPPFRTEGPVFDQIVQESYDETYRMRRRRAALGGSFLGTAVLYVAIIQYATYRGERRAWPSEPFSPPFQRIPIFRFQF